MLFIGCSDDETSTGTVGNLNDPEFLEVHGQVSELVDSTLTWFSEGLGSMSHVLGDSMINPIYYGPSGPDAKTDSSSVAYINGWHIIYFAYNAGDYYTVQVDSIQFRNGEIYQQNVSGLDAIRFRHNWQYDVLDTTATHCNYTTNTNFSFDNLDQGQCTVTGICNWIANSKQVWADSTVWRQFNVDVDITSGKIDKTGSGWAQGCPRSGNISADVAMIYQKNESVPDTTNWNVNISFNYGVASTTVTCGDVTWSYSCRECWAPQ